MFYYYHGVGASAGGLLIIWVYIYYTYQLGKTTVQTQTVFNLEPLNSVCEVSYREC